MIKIWFILCYSRQPRSQSPNFDNSELAYRSKVVEEKLNSQVASLRRANKRQLGRIFDRQNNTLNWQCASLGEQISAIWTELFDLKNVPIPLIDHVRHWGKQISPIWAKFFNLQTVPIPLIEDVRHLSGTVWSTKRANTLNWQCASLGRTNKRHLSGIL